MKTINEILKAQSDYFLIQVSNELKLTTVPMESKLRLLCSEIWDCKLEDTNTFMFSVLAMSLAIELGDRLIYVINCLNKKNNIETYE